MLKQLLLALTAVVFSAAVVYAEENVEPRLFDDLNGNGVSDAAENMGGTGMDPALMDPNREVPDIDPLDVTYGPPEVPPPATESSAPGSDTSGDSAPEEM